MTGTQLVPSQPLYIEGKVIPLDERDPFPEHKSVNPFILGKCNVKKLQWRKHVATPPEMDQALRNISNINNGNYLPDINTTRYVCLSTSPIYIYNSSGRKQAALELPEQYKSKIHDTLDANILTIEVVQSLQPGTELAKQYGVTNKTPLAERFIKGSGAYTRREFMTDHVHYGAIYVEELDLYYSLDPNCSCFDAGDGGAAVILDRLTSSYDVLRSDRITPVTVFVSDVAESKEVYYSLNGEDIFHATVIRTPNVQPGTLHVRYTCVGRDGKLYSKGTKAPFDDSKIYDHGGIIITPDLAIGYDPVKFHDWKKNTLVSRECFPNGVFYETDSERVRQRDETISELRTQLADTNINYERLRKNAKRLEESSKLTGGFPAVATSQFIKDVVQNKPVPEDPVPEPVIVEVEVPVKDSKLEVAETKSKILAQTATAVHKSVDSVYKVVAGAVAVCGILGTILFKYLKKDNAPAPTALLDFG